jgi:hypothetical protein
MRRHVDPEAFSVSRCPDIHHVLVKSRLLDVKNRVVVHERLRIVTNARAR